MNKNLLSVLFGIILFAGLLPSVHAFDAINAYVKNPIYVANLSNSTALNNILEFAIQVNETTSPFKSYIMFSNQTDNITLDLDYYNNFSLYGHAGLGTSSSLYDTNLNWNSFSLSGKFAFWKFYLQNLTSPIAVNSFYNLSAIATDNTTGTPVNKTVNNFMAFKIITDVVSTVTITNQSEKIGNYTLLTYNLSSASNEQLNAVVQLYIGYPSVHNDTIEISKLASNPFTINSYNIKLGDYYEIEPVSFDYLQSNLIWAYTKIYYNKTAVNALGINESSLRFNWFNPASQSWDMMNSTKNVTRTVSGPPYTINVTNILEGGVNTVEGYVWANTTHFSVYSIEVDNSTLPQSGQSPEPQPEPQSSSSGSSGGGSSGGSSGGSTGISHEHDLGSLSQTSVSKELSEGDKINFSVKNENHTATIKSIKTSSVDIELFSNPSNFTLEIGQTKKIDFHNDNFYDLSITLNSISGLKANLNFKEINEVIAACPVCPESDDWSNCVNSTQSRTYYRCDAATNYTCVLIVKEHLCETMPIESEKTLGLPTGLFILTGPNISYVVVVIIILSAVLLFVIRKRLK